MKVLDIMGRKRKNVFDYILLVLFLLFLFTQLCSAGIKCVWSGVAKIVAVGDIHGDYKNFILILKGTGIVDENLNWAGGKIHLVQTGDVMDRGPDARKVFDLLMRLEKEAEKAGGRVHALIGNHEFMNIAGISFDFPDYVTPEQFVSFLPDKYREKKEREFKEKASEKNHISNENKNLNKYWTQLIKNDRGARQQYIDAFNNKYGKWILKHNTVIKINDTIFVHGGISETYSTWKLKDINMHVRRELKGLEPYKLVYEGGGPLWFRDLAQKDENVYKQDVDSIFTNLKSKFMVIGHTPRTGSIVVLKDNMNRFQGRIWIIDTGISEYYGGHLSALIIENDNFIVWGEGYEK
jgi:hypothetical protein